MVCQTRGDGGGGIDQSLVIEVPLVTPLLCTVEGGKEEK